MSHLLLMVWLVMATCPSFTMRVGAMSMFANCSSINSNFTNSSGGGDFEAIGCNYPPTETIVSLSLGAGTTTTVYIAYGIVAAGASARLYVQCPPTVISQSLRITVTGIAFRQDASFRFTGALPPRSSMHISNNTFLLTKRNKNSFSLDPAAYSQYYTPAILIGDWATALVFEEGTAMSADNNTVTCLWAAGGSQSVVAVNVIGTTATLRGESTLSVSGNSIVNSSFSFCTPYVAYLYLYSSGSSSNHSLALSNITMNGNSIVNSSLSSSYAYVAYLYLYSSGSSSSNHSLTLSNITMSGNSIINCSISHTASVAYCYLYGYSSSNNSLTLSNITMSGNGIVNSSFGSSAYVAYLYLYSYSSSSYNSLTLTNIAISGNSIVNSIVKSSFGSNANMAYLYLDSFGSSSSSSNNSLTLSNITISGNGIVNSSFSSLSTPSAGYLFLHSFGSSSSSIHSLTLSNITISGNSIVKSSLSSGASVAYLFLYSYGSSSISSSNHNLTLSNIIMSGNSIVKSSLSSSANVAYLYLKSYGSSSSYDSLALSNVTMSGNSIVNSSFSRAPFVAYLYLYSYGSSSSSNNSFTLSNITISGNSIGNSIINSSFSSGAYVAYLYLYSYGSSSSSNNSLTLSNITMSGNGIVNSSFSSVAYVAYLYYSSGSSLALSNITMSGNSIVNSSFSSGAYVAHIFSDSSLTLSNQSAIAISGNNCSNSANVSLVVIEVDGPISLEGMASLSIDRNNAYITYGPSAVLRISAWQISLNDSSRISATGNILQAPVGQGGQPSSLLTISSSSGSGVLSISGNSSLVVALNHIIADAMALSVTMKVSAEYPSTIAIVDNHIGGRYVSGLAGFFEFYLNGEILATGNSVEAPSPIATFSLITIASTFTNDSLAAVQACGNNFSWVGHIQDAKLYLQPTQFALLAAMCLTPTLALSQSVSTSVSVTSALSLSPTDPMTHSATSKPFSKSTSESPSRNSSSVTLTRSMSNTTSIEPAKSQANCSIGDICQLVKIASDQRALFDTCTEPGPTETAVKDSTYVPLAKYIGNAANQAFLQSLGPVLLSGNVFYYGSVSVLWPEDMANVTNVAAASPAIAACWVYARRANETEIRLIVETLTVAAGTALDSASVPLVLMVLSLNVSCGAAAVVFNRTIAMERPVVYLPKVFVPDKAVHDAVTITGALSVTVGAVAVPIAAIQQGVALALLRMAQCEEDALNGEPLDVSVHPLQFGLGGGPGKYGRGALLGNLLVIPTVWCALMYLLVPFAIRALTGRTLDASRDFVGWPGMALMPLAVLSEGSAMASVGLLAQGGAGDIIMGLVGLAILCVATACWAAELRRMRRQVVLRRVSSVASWVKAVHPRFEWVISRKTDVANTSYLDRRMLLVGSSWWLWSAVAAQMLSLVVGVAEGLPVGPSLCRVRWAVASLAAVLQAAVVMTNTVPIELLLLGAIGVITCILVVLIALSTFDIVSPGSTFSALNAVGMANSVLGIALLGFATCTAAYETYTRRSRRARLSSQQPSSSLGALHCVLSVPMIPQQQATAPPVVATQRGRSSRYPDMPDHWAAILEEVDLAIEERLLAR